MLRTASITPARAIALALAALLLAAAALALNASRHPGTLNAGAETSGITIVMKVVGKKQGEIKGDSTLKGFENQITLTAFGFEIDSPRDPATGQASGHRSFKPITVTKQMDGASPQLLAATSTNEVLTSVVINFFRTSGDDHMVNFYRVTLTNATISAARQYTSAGTELEDLSFFFQKIEQDSLISKKTYFDDFVEAPV